MMDVAAGFADFRALGLHNVKLRRPREGGWGVKISDFAPQGHDKAGSPHRADECAATACREAAAPEDEPAGEGDPAEVTVCPATQSWRTDSPVDPQKFGEIRSIGTLQQ